MHRTGELLATDEIPYDTPMWSVVSVLSSHPVRTIKPLNAHAYFLTPTPRRSFPLGLGSPCFTGTCLPFYSPRLPFIPTGTRLLSPALHILISVLVRLSFGFMFLDGLWYVTPSSI